MTRSPIRNYSERVKVQEERALQSCLMRMSRRNSVSEGAGEVQRPCDLYRELGQVYCSFPSFSIVFCSRLYDSER